MADSDPFLTNLEWDESRSSGDFDYVVIGSSFCALGFIHQTIVNNLNAKILIIERGPCEDFRRLSPQELSDKSKQEETYDWEVSERMGRKEHPFIHRVRGMNNFFGGRSSFWKAWSPKPSREEMSGWPEEVVQRVQEYFPCAEKLLSVSPVTEIKSTQGSALFGKLQQTLHAVLKTRTAGDVQYDHISRIEHAPIAAVNNDDDECKKYSAIKPLFDILRKRPNVKAVVNCEAQRISHESGRATSLHTTRGTVNLGAAKLILAMSTLPSTSLMLDSFPHLQNIGQCFTGHFVSYITARVPISDQCPIYGFLQKLQPTDPLEMAAVYIAGRHPVSKHQFHLQLTAEAVTDSSPEDTCMRHLLKAPSREQLSTCKNHIVFVCATLGQLDHQNSDNWYRKAPGDRQATLQVAPNQNDDNLWEKMDETTFDILEKILTPAGGVIEYWHKNSKSWEQQQPPPADIRADGLVHPASTMWIGPSDSAPVSHNYQFYGIDNIYLTGGALWPDGASWNPTCTMTAMAMNLADIVTSRNSV